MEENDATVEALRIRIAKLERALTNLLSKGILASAEEDAAGDVRKILAGEDIETEEPPKNGPGYGWMFDLANGNGFTSDRKEAEKLREAGFDTRGIFVMFVDGEPDRELTDDEVEKLLAEKL
ncbi:hypothetical protein IKF57_02840 [Candidatus Saccharibacteria bacterium]|nr:hypothetical protein [Candidatus Saccharibacteria bacterium]